MAFLFVPSHVNETSDPVDNLGGILSVVLVGALILAINFAPVPNEGTLVLGLSAIAAAALLALLHSPAASRESALRPERRRAARLLGRGVRGDHRVRLADGSDVRQPAVPPERERVFDARGRGGDPARGARHGGRRATLCQARRGTRGPLHAALRLRVPVPRIRLDAAPLERGVVRTGRSRSHTSSSAPASVSPERPRRTR